MTTTRTVTVSVPHGVGVKTTIAATTGMKIMSIDMHPHSSTEVKLTGVNYSTDATSVTATMKVFGPTFNTYYDAVFSIVEVESAASDMGWVDVTSFGAVGNNSTDNTQAIADAIASLPTANPKGGVIYFPRGMYRLQYMDLSSIPQGTEFRGEGWAIGSSNYPGSTLIFTNTTGSCIRADGKAGVAFKHLVMEPVNTAENNTKAIIDFGPNSEASYNCVEDVYIKGASKGFIGVNFSRSTNSRIEKCHIQACHTAIQLQPDAGTYCNGCVIRDTVFHTSSSTHIRGLGAGLVIDNCTFEPRSTNDAGAIFCTTNQVNNDGVTISNCWMGDTTVPGQYWFTLFGKAINVYGNFLGNHGINLLNNTSAIVIRGNHIYTDNVAGINFGTGITQYDCSCNTFTGTNPIVGSGTYTNYTA